MVKRVLARQCNSSKRGSGSKLLCAIGVWVVWCIATICRKRLMLCLIVGVRVMRGMQCVMGDVYCGMIVRGVCGTVAQRPRRTRGVSCAVIRRFSLPIQAVDSCTGFADHYRVCECAVDRNDEGVWGRDV